jgi:hypothetical protein
LKDKGQASLTPFNGRAGLLAALALLLALAFLVCSQASKAFADSTVIELQDIDSGLTSPSGSYRWRDVADQAYSAAYQDSYNYTTATVVVVFDSTSTRLRGTLTATELRPNFAYQLKLAGLPDTDPDANERIGLAGRWWQEEWNGSSWASGQNLNDKGDGSSPNPNDKTYLSRRDITDTTSPTGLHYRYTGYLVFNYFITDNDGNAIVDFETDSSYHVLWKTSQQARSANDGPLKTTTFDADFSAAYDDAIDYVTQTISIFEEWERLPVGGVYLQDGDYHVQMVLTEESFHGSGGSLSGNWAAAMGAEAAFSIGQPTAVKVASFTARRQASTVLLTWETATEIDMIGFHLHRADAPDGKPVRLDETLIPSQNPGGPSGFSYEFTDKTTRLGQAYTYWLEDVDEYGVGTCHGPVVVPEEPVPLLRVFLPLILVDPGDAPTGLSRW